MKDTYGLPIEEILLIAKDADLHVDEKRYQLLEEEAKQRSRKIHKTVEQIAGENACFAEFAKKFGETKFKGYTERPCQKSYYCPGDKWRVRQYHARRARRAS